MTAAAVVATAALATSIAAASARVAAARVPRTPAIAAARLLHAGDVTNDARITAGDAARWFFARRLLRRADRHPRDHVVTRAELRRFAARYAGANKRFATREWRRLLRALGVAALPAPTGVPVTGRPPAQPVVASPAPTGPAPPTGLPTCADVGGVAVAQKAAALVAAYDQDADNVVTDLDGFWAGDLLHFIGFHALTATNARLYVSKYDRHGPFLCIEPAEDTSLHQAIMANSPPPSRPPITAPPSVFADISLPVFDRNADGSITALDGPEARAWLTFAGAAAQDQAALTAFLAAQYDTAPTDGVISETEAVPLFDDRDAVLLKPRAF